MHLDFARLRWPEWLIGLAGLVLIASLVLLPWYTLVLVSTRPRYFSTTSVDGWHGLAHARWLVLVTVVVALAVVFFQARERAPALPVAMTVILGPLAAATLVWLIVRVWISPPGGREVGGWIGLLSAGALTYGSYRSLRLEGIAEKDAPVEIPTATIGEEGAT